MARPKRLRWGFIVLGGLVIALVIWAMVGNSKPPKTSKTPIVAVFAAKALVQDVPVSITALGSAQAWQSVLVRTQVNGKLLRVPVQEGSYVPAGALLAEIDPAPYRAILMQAQGALQRDQALLAAARVDLKRFQTLAAQDSIATQQLDTQAALVKQDEGAVLLDKGVVAAAQVNVDYCRITAPVAGRVGLRLVDSGNIVSTTDTTGIVSVDQVVPIAVTFTIPQGDFQRLSDVSGGFARPLTTEALSQETGADLGQGEVSITDNHVDQTTGTVTLKARFANANKRLWPSQFVNVKLTLQTLPHATTIPSAAVNQGPKGAFTYVVGADHKVSMRPIVVAAVQDPITAIKSGVRPGETVVTDGQLSLKSGSTVAIHTATSAKTPAA